jgi:hypothetical protein
MQKIKVLLVSACAMFVSGQTFAAFSVPELEEASHAALTNFQNAHPDHLQQFTGFRSWISGDDAKVKVYVNMDPENYNTEFDFLCQKHDSAVECLAYWVDVTTTDGTTPSSCEKTPANCAMKDMKGGLKWSKILPVHIKWQGALDACAALTHNGQKAGSWRLPTESELVNAEGNRIANAAIANPKWIASNDLKQLFWSATPGLDDSYAFVVHMEHGNSTSMGPKSELKAVVCVQ